MASFFLASGSSISKVCTLLLTPLSSNESARIFVRTRPTDNVRLMLKSSFPMFQNTSCRLGPFHSSSSSVPSGESLFYTQSSTWITYSSKQTPPVFSLSSKPTEVSFIGLFTFMVYFFAGESEYKGMFLNSLIGCELISSRLFQPNLRDFKKDPRFYFDLSVLQKESEARNDWDLSFKKFKGFTSCGAFPGRLEQIITERPPSDYSGQIGSIASL
ncbi:hypothetical protein FGO68_gene7846 [Halteria grandinella]|uniref:Uncharacterized protein n=1 Tax=Halteria grandinella TaxID=5974 RepID=A0A8J8NAG6_HALGN|nr:hypothetical protein FGO68_gene7846 [Halteria grandinella]